MKRFFHSFNVKISSLFLILLITMGIAQILISVKLTEKRQVEVDQVVNRDLARDMAREIEPQLGESSDLQSVGSIIHYMMVLNPAIEIYILSETGQILAFFAEEGKEVRQSSVDLVPVENFLKELEIPPIYGDDPRHPGQKKHFSAARIQYGNGKNGYLYIVLRSTIYDVAADMLKEKYIVSTLWRGLLISMFSVGIIGLILFAFLTKRLHLVAQSVREFQKSNYEKRLPIRSKDEFGELAATFNLMADRIVEDMEKLKQTDRLRRELIAMKYKTEARIRQVNLEAELPKSLHMVRADIGMLQRVISNLLKNALNFTKAHGSVVLRISETNGNIRLSVSDTGQGIPENELPYIFDRYYRGERNQPRSKSGSGLGLAISKKILELHRSSLEVNSMPGKGSVFFFELPRIK